MIIWLLTALAWAPVFLLPTPVHLTSGPVSDGRACGRVHTHPYYWVRVPDT